MAKKSAKKRWFENGILRFAAILSAVAAIGGIGYTAAAYKLEIQYMADSMKSDREWTEKIGEVEKACEDSLILRFRSGREDLIEFQNNTKR